MMTKHTSRGRAMLTGSAVALIVLLSGFCFSGRTYTIERSPSRLNPVPALTGQNDEVPPEIYFKGATIWQKNKAGKYEPKQYDEMTAAEKAALPPVPPVLTPRRTPTVAQFQKWSNAVRYHVYDHETNECVNPGQLNPADYAGYLTHTIYVDPHTGMNKTSKRTHYVLVMLYTESSYQEQFIKPRLKPGKKLTVCPGADGWGYGGYIQGTPEGFLTSK